MDGNGERILFANDRPLVVLDRVALALLVEAKAVHHFGDPRSLHCSEALER